MYFGSLIKNRVGTVLRCMNEANDDFSKIKNIGGGINRSKCRHILYSIHQAENALREMKDSVESILKKSFSAEWSHEFAKNNRNRFKFLNENLFKIEGQIEKEVAKIKTEMNHRIKTAKNFVEDYEIEIIIGFYINENEPEWDNIDDKMIAELSFMAKYRKYLFSDSSGKKDWRHVPGPLDNFDHCCLFHCLLDHTDPILSFRDLLKISNVWVDIQVWHQKRYDLNQQIYNK